MLVIWKEKIDKIIAEVEQEEEDGDFGQLT